jgi:hypothetical protein
MISEVAEVKNQHESVCDEGCPENCEYCEDEGKKPETSCVKCIELRTTIPELEELMKQHIENEKKELS